MSERSVVFRIELPACSVDDRHCYRVTRTQGPRPTRMLLVFSSPRRTSSSDHERQSLQISSEGAHLLPSAPLDCDTAQALPHQYITSRCSANRASSRNPLPRVGLDPQRTFAATYQVSSPCTLFVRGPGTTHRKTILPALQALPLEAGCATTGNRQR
jgi:hypothetical protein